MRILIVVDCYLPYKKSSAKLVHDLAVEFHHQGHEVIITAPDHALTAPSQVSIEQGLKVLRIRSRPIKGAERMTRAINEIRLSSIIWKAGKAFFKSNRCDLIVLYAPSIFFASLIKKLKTLKNYPLEYAYAIGMIAGIVGLLLNASYIDVFAASKVAETFWAFTGILLAITYGIKKEKTAKKAVKKTK